MAEKKIEPVNPATTSADAKSAEAAERKTNQFKYRMLACIEAGRKSGRRTNNFKI